MTIISFSSPGPYTETGKMWYDTKEGINEAIKTLSGFLNLRHERHQAGYVRKEVLNQVYVLGDYSFDTVGNCLVSEPSIKKLHPNIPNVLTNEEFQAFLKENSKNENFSGFSFAYDQNIPSEKVCCPVCGKGWTIENISDVVTRRTNEMVGLADFVGKPLKEALEFYRGKTDADYFIGTDPFMQSKRFIDLSPWTDNPKDEFEKTMVKNKSGWVGTKEGITGDYIIQNGDELYLTLIHYYHSSCNSDYVKTSQQNSFQEIFTKAGFSKIELVSIPNEYCGCPYCAPWFKVTTEIGTFKIGWRKRVINIDWTELDEKKDFSPLFAEEDVTKYKTSIHAWGNDKAIEYLSKILNFCKG